MKNGRDGKLWNAVTLDLLLGTVMRVRAGQLIKQIMI